MSLSCFATFSSNLEVSAILLHSWVVGILRHCLIMSTEYTLSWRRLLLLIKGFCCCRLFPEVFLWVEVSRCNPGQPGTHCVDQVELKLGEWWMGWTAHHNPPHSKCVRAAISDKHQYVFPLAARECPMTICSLQIHNWTVSIFGDYEQELPWTYIFLPLGEYLKVEGWSHRIYA